MKKERCGLQKLHKGFWLCLCAVALVVTCCAVVLHNVQASGTDGWVAPYDDSKGGYVLEKAPKNISGNVTIPAEYEPVVEIGREAFLDCTGLTKITIPSSVKSIGWYAFSGCTGLTEITIPDSVTEMDWFAFSNCTGLETVTIGSGLKEISAGAFSGCTNLTDVTISGSETIGWSAFKDCTRLLNIVIPSSVTSIDRYAFYNCDKLSNVYYNGSEAEWGVLTNNPADGNSAVTEATLTYISFDETVRHNLRLQDLIKVGYAFATAMENEDAEYGVLIWEGDENLKLTVASATKEQNKKLEKQKTSTNCYLVAESNGIYAQKLGENLYAKPYVKIGNCYIYGNVDTYTPVSYAQTILESDNEKLKQLMVDLLNYGTCAQLYFATQPTGTNPDKLINADLTDTQKDFGSTWDEEFKVKTPETTGEWAANLNLLDAIQLNIAIKNTNVHKMQYWAGANYADMDWTEENYVTTVLDGDWAVGNFPGIAAQHIGKWYCVKAYDANGSISEIRIDSVAANATRLIDSPAGNVNDEARALAKALILYGNSAKAYFNPQNG